MRGARSRHHPGIVLHFLHTLLGTRNEERFQKAIREIARHQNEDGGWPIYQGGPSNISASVKAYFAFKLCGHGADEPALVKARTYILSTGAFRRLIPSPRFIFARSGQYDYDAVPAIPPEIVLFPNWFWFNIYEISSWSRAILIPLSICYAKKPFRKIAPEQGIDELFPNGRLKSQLRLKWDDKLISWRNFFLVLDRMTHMFESVYVRPLRWLALRKAEKWMLERLEMSDGLGAIYPGILNSIIALRCLGTRSTIPR